MNRLSSLKPIAILAVAVPLLLSGCGKKPEVAAPSPTVSATPSPGSTTAPSTSPGKTTGSTPSSSVPSGVVTAVRLADPQSGWVGGEGWIARTDDGGHSWKTDYEGKGTVRQLFALNGQTIWAAISNGSDSSASLIASTDGGAHWSTAGTVPNTGFLHFVSPTEAFSANAHTTDGGKTWTPIPVPSKTVGDAYFHDNQNGWVVIQPSSDTMEVDRSTDGG